MPGSTTVVGHPGPAPAVPSQNGFAYGSEHKNQGSPGGGTGTGAGGRPPFKHIDDITGIRVEPPKNASIESVIKNAEFLLQQAIFHKDLNRLDHALGDYLRAYTTVAEVIPNHKEWLFLRGSNKAGSERYNSLIQRLIKLDPDFEKIKAEIIADNARTGILPKSQASKLSTNGVAARSQTGHKDQANSNVDDAAGSSRENTNGKPVLENGAPRRPPPPPPPPRSKPVVHPKPHNLHGKAIQQTGVAVASNKDSLDLVQRFANLRAGNIKVQTPPPRQAVVDNSDAHAPQRLSQEAPVRPSTPVELPRLPDAIYNPARGTITSEAAELPSSAPRAMFTRTNSTTSMSHPNRSSRMSISTEHSMTQTSASTLLTRTKLPIPEGETISAEDLERYMRAGVKEISILLIDIRSREDFDEGHIMSQATICVDPEVLQREHISAFNIAESMVLAPASEMVLFEKRHEFDLVVFYDHQSERILSNAITPEQQAIIGIYNALTEFDYPDAGSKTKIKMLKGGLDAWINIMGRGGLQTSASSSAPAGKPQRRTPMTQLLARRQTHVARPIQDANEVRRWEEMISDVSPIRTTEDFLRRFPSVATIQESMTSPTSPVGSRPASPFQPRISHEETIYSSLPSPPARPPPTVPRRSYSGLADTENNSMTAKRLSLKQGVDRFRPFRTGLRNPGVFCFANSSLQAMFATPGFARDIYTEAWKNQYRVPMKPKESAENPQLLIKWLSNVFKWLDQGSSKSMSVDSFMGYIRHIHGELGNGRRKRDAETFGGPCQQDAQEFYSFIMDTIDDETNIHRDKVRSEAPSNQEALSNEYKKKDGTIVENAMDFWRIHSTTSASIVDKYFRGLEVFISKCQNPSCREEIRKFQTMEVCILSLAEVTRGETDLDHLLVNHQKHELFQDLVCETCKKPGRTRRPKFARLPDRLAFCLNRFSSGEGRSIMNGGGGGGSHKIHTKVRFPIRNLDLTEYCAEPDPDMTLAKDPHFAGRMLYDCYAVTVHVGAGINGGHYYTYVQDEQSRDPTDWFRCNDDMVDRVKIGSSMSDGGGHHPGGPRDVTEDMYQKNNASAYMVYYRRQGT